MSRADISAGKAHVELYVKNSKFVKGLNAASRQLTSFGRDIASIGLSMQAAGAAALVPLGAAVKFASNMEEQMNKFNVVFGEASVAVRKWADETGEALGRSKTQMVTFMASVQDLLKPMGFAEEQATELSKQISTLAIDLASFNNLVDADVLRDLQSALTGSGQVMKKYGVILTQAKVEQELFNMGLDPKAANDQQKAMARLNIIMAGTVDAQGDAERSGGSFANMMKRLRADIENGAVAIGSAFLPMLQGIMPRVRELLKGLVEWVSANKQTIQTVGILSAALFTLGTVVTTTGLSIVAFGKTLAAVTFLVTAMAKGIALLTSAFLLLGTPMGLIVTGLTALTIGFLTATDSGKKTAKELMGAFESISATWKNTMGGIIAALESGDFRLAGSIAAQGFKTIFLTAFAEIEIGFRSLMTDMLKLLLKGLVRMSSALNLGWLAETLGESLLADIQLENINVARQRRGAAQGAGADLAGMADQARAPGIAKARQAELKSVRDQTSRMTDIDETVRQQNAELIAAENEMRQRIAQHLKQEAEQRKKQEELNAQRLKEEQAEFAARKMIASAMQREQAQLAKLQAQKKGADVISAFRQASQQRMGMVMRDAQMKRLSASDDPKSAEMLTLMRQQNQQMAMMLHELRIGRAVFE